MQPVNPTPFIHTCGLFDEFLLLRSARRFLDALQHSPAWELKAHESLPREVEWRGAYAVLSGRVTLESEPVGEEARPRRVFGQWTGLRGLPLEDWLVFHEDSVLLECNQELLQLLLQAQGLSSTFEVEFLLPLAQAVPPIADTPVSDLEAVLRSSECRVYAAGDRVVVKDEIGNTMFFVLAGETRVQDPKAVAPVMGPGSFFGELAVITQGPRTNTVVAQTDCLLMECSRRAVADLRKKSKTFKAAILDTYRDRLMMALLRKTALFRSLETEQLVELCRVGELDTFEPYEPIVLQGDTADSLYVALNGTMHVVAETPEGPIPIAAVRGGETVGEMAFPELGGRGVRSSTVTALQNVDVVRIPAPAFAELLVQHPAVAAKIRATVAERAAANASQENSARRTASLAWMMETQHGAGEAVLAVDMNDCIRCGNCVSACAAVHEDGISRFNWAGMREDDSFLPQVKLSNSCKHCEFALCMRNCPTNALVKSPGGAVFIDYDKCIQCGKCGDPSTGCPYGSIRITSAQDVRLQPKVNLLQRLLGKAKPVPLPPPPEGVRKGNHYPVKCDLCEGQEFQACVRHCPTSAVFRLDGSVQFSDALNRLSRLTGPSTLNSQPSTPPGRAEFHLRVTLQETPLPGKPFEVDVHTSSSGPGKRLLARKPEPGVPNLTINTYLTIPEGFNVGGGAMRQMTLSATDLSGVKNYKVTGKTPGEHHLNLLVYQGGLYLGRECVTIQL